MEIAQGRKLDSLISLLKDDDSDCIKLSCEQMAIVNPTLI
jgi:hypothetical protein